MIISGFDWQNAKVLVTGASGFKGAWLCAAVRQLGAQVYGTVRSQPHPASAYKIFGLDDIVVAAAIDVSDHQQVYDLVNSIEPDVIFHLAAKALVPVGLRDPRRTFDVNINGTLNIIEACRKLRVCSRMLVCSTDHVFGNVEPFNLPQGGFKEDARVSYGGPYDTSKAAMELLVRSYHYTFWSELPAIGITRCANVFGFGDTNSRRIIPEFVSSAKRDRFIKVKYKRNGRQFIYVTDAVAGYIYAVSNLAEGGHRKKDRQPKPPGRVPFTPTFHFAIENYEGTQEPYIEAGGVAELAAKLFGADVDLSGADYAPNENRIQALNCAATRKNLGWEPKFSLSQGLNRLGQWYESRNDSSELRKMMQDDVETLTSTLR